MNDRFLSRSRSIFFCFFVLSPFLAQSQTALDSLPPIDSLTDWQVNGLTQQLATQAGSFELVLSEKGARAVARRSELEERVKMAKADSTIARTDIDSLGGLLKIAKSEEKTALRRQNQAAKTLELANKSVEADNITQRKNLNKLWKETRQLRDVVYPPVIEPKETETIAEPVQKDKKREKKKKPSGDTPPAEAPVEPTAVSQPPAVADSLPATPGRPQSTIIRRTKKYDPATDVMLNPPELSCAMAVDTRDELSGERYRRIAGGELFRHAPAVLKNFLQGKPNVQCEAALASAGVNGILNLTFTINDPNPRKSFGKLDKNSIATLWFMDGSTFSLNNQQADEGVQNPETQAYVFQARYALNAEVLKKMRRMELDKIRIAWSSGYEDYDVQYVRLLMQQARCLFE